MRPTTGPIRRDKPAGIASSGRHKRKPPRGMYLDHEDLVTFSAEPEIQSDAVLKGMDSEIVALKRLVYLCKLVAIYFPKFVILIFFFHQGTKE